MSKNSTKWNQSVDAQLRILHEDLSISNWAVIAEKLNSVFGESDRTPKQCRQRYINSVKFSKADSLWERSEEELLRFQFLRLGPKWAQISHSIPGRSQNSIKNKFNAELRKTLRKLNNYCKVSLAKHRKPLNNEWFRRLSKEVFKNPQGSHQRKSYAAKLMSKLVQIVLPPKILQVSGEEQIYLNLLNEICLYNKNFIFSKKKGQPDSFYKEQNRPQYLSDELEEPADLEIKSSHILKSSKAQSCSSINEVKVESIENIGNCEQNFLLIEQAYYKFSEKNEEALLMPYIKQQEEHELFNHFELSNRLF